MKSYLLFVHLKVATPTPISFHFAAKLEYDKMEE